MLIFQTLADSKRLKLFLLLQICSYFMYVWVWYISGNQRNFFEIQDAIRTCVVTSCNFFLWSYLYASSGSLFHWNTKTGLSPFYNRSLTSSTQIILLVSCFSSHELKPQTSSRNRTQFILRIKTFSDLSD